MFNEDNTVEQMLIEAATQSSWQYVKSQDIPRSSDSVLVESLAIGSSCQVKSNNTSTSGASYL